MTIQELPIKIYGLVSSSEPDHIRYIGKTKNKLKYRLQQHISQTSKKGRNTIKCNWIKSQIKKGYIISIIEIESCLQSNWVEREKYWIKFYKDSNHRLTNMTEGGDGVSTNIGESHPAFGKIGENSWNFGKNRKKNWDVSPPHLTKAKIKLTAMINPINDEVVTIFNSPKEAAFKMQISRFAIVNVAGGRRKTYYGYKWKYI